MNIVFMGTPDFARESLKALYEADYNIEAVVTNPDKPKGRGMKMIASPVKEYAIEKSITIYQPEKIRKNEEFINKLKEINPDVICVVAYGKILPKEILDIPKYGCINVHASLLPKYRGAAPIQWAILNGDKETGITTMYMDIGMDTGDMILQEKVQIDENETTGELWDRLSVLGGKLLVETLKQIEMKVAPRISQSEDFSMAPMLNKEMAKIDWTKSAEEIKNLVRGLNPIMGAYTIIDNKKIKFWKAKNLSKEEVILKYNDINLEKIEKAEVGVPVYANNKKGLLFKTNDGFLDILEIQGENAKRMQVCEFLRGNQIKIYNLH